ncbi:MAG: hypothetical protein PVJ66_09955 [Gammaproteobacteria bacterium]|jgi:hypothetical protein
MGKGIGWAKRLWCTGLVAGLLVLAGSAPVLADPPGRSYFRGDKSDYRGKRRDYRDKHNERRDYRSDRRDRDRRYAPRERYQGYYPPSRVISRGRPYVVPGHRMRRYRDVVIVRPHGYWYPGYAHYYDDDDAYKWLAFTAITLKLLDNLNEAQQREHEAAQIAATTAPIGERIIWSEGGASGAVIATREGTAAGGRYCREFLQEVTVAGRAEQAYGTACRQPDGSWEVVATE